MKEKEKEGNQDANIFTIKGDALREAEPQASDKMILGKIVQLDRKGRTIVFKRDKSFKKGVSGIIDKLCFWKK